MEIITIRKNERIGLTNAETTMVYEELMKMENLNERVCDMR